MEGNETANDNIPEDMVLIDGSIGEGGGQVLRISTALSVLLHKPIRVTNIRANRRKPGLAAQHVKGLELARDLCHGFLEGCSLGSKEITFFPGDFIDKKDTSIKVDIETAGSVVLLLQVSLPIMMFSKASTSLELIGGTDVDFSPSIDYFTQVFKPFLKKHFKIDFEVDLLRRGFFPKGRGIVKVRVDGNQIAKPLPPITNFTRAGDYVHSVTGTCFVSGVLDINVAHRAADAAEFQCKKLLREVIPKGDKKSNHPKTKIKIERIEEPYERAFGTGCGILLTGLTNTSCILSSSAIGKRGKPAEVVGKEAAEDLMTEFTPDLNHCVDQYLQDQMLIFLSLSSGNSVVRTGQLTLHTETAIQVIEIMVGRKVFDVSKSPENESSVLLSCNGIGFTRKTED